MLKDSLEIHAARMAEAIGETLRDMRGLEAKVCLICQAAAGDIHRPSCAAWPVIYALAAYRTAVELERPQQEDLLTAPRG